MSDPTPQLIDGAPALDPRSLPLIAALGARASYRFLEFFTAKIRNPHTRRAYARAAVDFGCLALAAGLLGLNANAVLSKARNRDKAVI
jgi:hypothetical protein